MIRNKEELNFFVYTMCNVGTCTMLASLKELNLGKVISGHRFTKKGLQETKEHGKNVYFTSLAQHLETNYLIGQQVTKRKKCIKSISLTRDPVLQNIGHFFSTINHRYVDFYEQYKKETITLTNLKSDFLEDEYIHNNPLKWFNEEIKELLKIDVFASPFPKGKGYKIYNDHLIVIRLEDLNNCAKKAFEEFLGVKKFKVITRDREEDNKKRFPIYKKFIEDIKLPTWYLNKMYDSKLAKHFYTPKEIKDFRKRWE